MTELAKCRCGATARITADFAVARDPDVPESAFGPRHLIPVPDGHYEIECPGDCGVYVWAPTLEKAAGRWNSLMRPRPVAEWGEAAFSEDLFVGDVSLGGVHEDSAWCAVCLLDGGTFAAPNLSAARAWLIERVRAAGFDVEEDLHGG